MLLPDTSVWVEYFRRGSDGAAGPLDELAARRELVTCGPVVVELLAGTSRDDRERLSRTLEGLPWVDLGRREWIRVGEIAGELRAAGATVALTDIEIAVAAMTAEAVVWSADSDFERIAAVVGELQTRPLA